MDLLRRTGWLRVLTVALVALGSTAVGAQPRGPAHEAAAEATGDGTASETGLSLVVTANAVGVIVSAAEREAEAATGAAPPDPGERARAPRRGDGPEQRRPAPIAERPLRYRLCVYRL